MLSILGTLCPDPEFAQSFLCYASCGRGLAVWRGCEFLKAATLYVCFNTLHSAGTVKWSVFIKSVFKALDN